MKTLDKIWEKCSIINPDFKIEEPLEDVLIVRQVFKYPERMLDFQTLLSKWESCGNAKPGLMSLKMPFWTGNIFAREVFKMESFMEQFTETEFIYFYWNNTMKFADGLEDPKNLQTGNCLLPHNDPPQPGDEIHESIIGLVNLNPRPVRTGFWEMNGKMYGDEDTLDELSDYVADITEENYEERINNGVLDNVKNIEYSFNDALFYNSRLLHQPWIDKFYTRDNPRIMLRVSYNILEEGFEDEECEGEE